MNATDQVRSGAEQIAVQVLNVMQSMQDPEESLAVLRGIVSQLDPDSLPAVEAGIKTRLARGLSQQDAIEATVRAWAVTGIVGEKLGQGPAGLGDGDFATTDLDHYYQDRYITGESYGLADLGTVNWDNVARGIEVGVNAVAGLAQATVATVGAIRNIRRPPAAAPAAEAAPAATATPAAAPGAMITTPLMSRIAPPPPPTLLEQERRGSFLDSIPTWAKLAAAGGAAYYFLVHRKKG